jgi:hypothetical protein
VRLLTGALVLQLVSGGSACFSGAVCLEPPLGAGCLQPTCCREVCSWRMADCDNGHPGHGRDECGVQSWGGDVGSR